MSKKDTGNENNTKFCSNLRHKSQTMILVHISIDKSKSRQKGLQDGKDERAHDPRTDLFTHLHHEVVDAIKIFLQNNKIHSLQMGYN